MAAGGTIHLLVADPADISTPSTGHIALFADSTNSNIPSYKDDTGTVFELTGPAGGAGSPGSIGPPGMAEENDPEPILIPGNRGPQGVQGIPGVAGDGGGASGSHLMFDADVEDATPQPPGLFKLKFIGCSLRNSANQVLTTAIDNFLTFDTEEIDTDGFHTGGSPTRITIPSHRVGKYIFIAGCRFADNQTDCTLTIKKGGTTYMAAMSTRNAGASVVSDLIVTSRPLVCVAADFFEVSAIHNVGSNLNSTTSSDFAPFFSCIYLGS